MSNHHQQLLLTINTGSSSLKLGLYRLDSGEELVLSAQAERIGATQSQLHVADVHRRFGRLLPADCPGRSQARSCSTLFAPACRR